MKKTLLISLAVLMVLSTVAFAAAKTPTDTLATTNITAPAASNTLVYKNVALTTQPTQYSDTITVAVAPIWGLSGIGDAAGVTVEPSATATYTYTIQNEGNVTDDYRLYTTGSFGAWDVRITNAGGTDISTIQATEDQQVTFYVKVTPPASAVNGDYLDVTTIASCGADALNVGEYTGANGNLYSGLLQASDATRTYVNASVMTITRTATVDAPLGYIANGGGAHDAVPGAVITYRIAFNNIGGNAKDAVITDVVPTYTTALHVGRVTGEASANVNITDAGEVNAGNWTVSEFVPGTGWVSLGTGKQALSATATQIKFENPTVLIESGVLTWGVTIK